MILIVNKLFSMFILVQVLLLPRIENVHLNTGIDHAMEISWKKVQVMIAKLEPDRPWVEIRPIVNRLTHMITNNWDLTSSRCDMFRRKEMIVDAYLMNLAINNQEGLYLEEVRGKVGLVLKARPDWTDHPLVRRRFEEVLHIVHNYDRMLNAYSLELLHLLHHYHGQVESSGHTYHKLPYYDYDMSPHQTRIREIRGRFYELGQEFKHSLMLAISTEAGRQAYTELLGQLRLEYNNLSSEIETIYRELQRAETSIEDGGFGNYVDAGFKFKIYFWLEWVRVHLTIQEEFVDKVWQGVLTWDKFLEEMLGVDFAHDSA